MRAPAFWWREPGLAAAPLRPIGSLYGAVAARRLGQHGVGVGIPVVCVGDPTVGGGGKTPTALSLARVLSAGGERPVFLTRGYGGLLKGPVRVDPGIHGASEVGDEPLLLAREHATVQARDRIAGAKFARDAGASVIVMDDGFQNPSLAKDFSVLVVDAARGIGNGLVLPAGPLRAPLDAQLERANAVVAIGEGGAAALLRTDAAMRGLPVLRAALMPSRDITAALRGRLVLAFAGIGNPQKFYRTLAAAGIEVCAERSFPDHHAYTEEDATRLLGEADAQGLALVTTEKDWVRLAGGGARAALRGRATALPVRLMFEDEAEVSALLREKIRERA